MKNIRNFFQSQEKKSSPIDSLELMSDQDRRKLFLRYVNRAWLIFGFVTLATIPIYPGQYKVFIYLIVVIFPTYLITRFLNLSGKTKLAGVIFTLSVNFGFYGLFMERVGELGASKAFESEISIWLLMGLAVLFAGAFIDKWAAPGLALINSVLLISTRLTLAPDSDPRPSALVLWWMMALTIWFYERTLGEASRRVLDEFSERKHTEEELNLNKVQLLANLENTPNVAIQWYDRDGHILYWNPASELMYGWNSADALGKTLDQLIHTPEEQAEFMRILAEVQETGKPFGPYEAQIRRHDGTSSWVLATTFSIPMDNEQIGFVCMDVDIAERKEAADNLRKAEAKYRTLVEQIPPIVYITEPDQHIGVSYISPQIKRLGFTEEEWVADPELWLRQLHPDDRPKVLEDLERIRQTGIPYNLEYRLRTREGNIRWFLDEVMDIVDKDGKVLFRQGFMLDITERKQAEEKLRESEERLRRAQKIAHVGHWVWDTQTNHVSLSDEMYEILGLDRRSFTGNLNDMLQQTTHPSDLARVLSTVEKTTRDQSPTGIEYRIVRPDESIRYIWAEPGDQVRHESGKILRLSGIIQDITERTLAEKTLKESEERFRLLSEVSMEGIQIHENGFVLDANLALAKQLGYGSPDEIIGKQIMQKHLTPESLKKVAEVIASRTGVTYEAEGIRNDGTHFPVEITSYMLNINGRDLRIASTRDITERKHAENALQENEYKLRTIFETMAEGVALNEIIYDENGEMIDYRILEVNQAYYSTAGYTDQDVVGKLATDIYGMSAEFIKSFWVMHRNQNEVQHTELSSPLSDKWFYVSTSPFIDNRFVTSFFEITERKRAETELHARVRYHMLLRLTTSGILNSKNAEERYDDLLTHFVNLFIADFGYFLRWDTDEEQAILIASTTSSMDPRSSELVLKTGQSTLSQSILQTERSLVINNLSDLEDPFKSDLFNDRPESVDCIFIIPLIARKYKLGILILAYKINRQLTTTEIKNAEEGGEQIALALWNVEQEAKIQQQLHEAQKLAEIAFALSETERLGLSNILHLIVASAKELISNVKQAVIHLLNEKEQILVYGAVLGFEGPDTGSKKMRLGEGIAGQAILSGETINITDINTDERFLKFDSEPAYRSLMVTPILKGRQRLGTISIQSDLPNAFTLNDIKLLGQLSTQAAIAIENTNLLEHTRQALNESNALYRINQRLVASLDPQELMEDVVNLLEKDFGYYYSQILIKDSESGNYILKAGSGEVGKKLVKSGHYRKAGEGIVGYVAETGEAFFTNNVEDTVIFVHNPAMPNTKSEMATPIKVNDEIIGILDVQLQSDNIFTANDIRLVNAVVDQLAVALQKADLYETLQTSLQQEKATRNQLVQNERLAMMGLLLATVSHELNNPLQAIQNALFLLREENNFSPQGRQDLEIVLAESERMANMIERLRATYRPSQEDDFIPTQINSVIEDVYALISTHLRQNRIVFEFHPDPDLPNILALADPMRQVLLNLLMNAVEAMTTGGILTVSTKLLRDSNEVLFTVLDTGPGIAADLLQDIFTPFITNKQRGTGLGLAISYDIVMKHHGRMTAENNTEEDRPGALFKVWLPITTKDSE